MVVGPQPAQAEPGHLESRGENAGCEWDRITTSEEELGQDRSHWAPRRPRDDTTTDEDRRHAGGSLSVRQAHARQIYAACARADFLHEGGFLHEEGTCHSQYANRFADILYDQANLSLQQLSMICHLRAGHT